MKKKNAISLIVLVITIIVMAILAATVIITLSNTNIISEANDAVKKTEAQQVEEMKALMLADGMLGKNPGSQTIGDTTLTWDSDSKTVIEKTIKDGTTKVDTVTIPKDFYYVGGTKNTGLVISDDAKDENKGVGYTCTGNQFVWVPVEYTATGTTDANGLDTGFTSVFKRGGVQETSKGSGIYKMTGTLLSSYTEPYADGYATEEQEYYAMMQSVQKYNGFYIARFEAGDGDATTARTLPTVAHTVVSKKGAYVYNYSLWGAANNDTSPFTWTNVDRTQTVENVAGVVELSKNMYKGSTSVVSTLCYGVQWDAVMNFVSDAEHNIKKSESWGNYSGTLQTCGYSEDWKAKNIYDLSGNVMEWTMEFDKLQYDYDSFNYTRLFRGGACDGKRTPGGAGGEMRFGGEPDSGYNNYYNGMGVLMVDGSFNDLMGFRPALYIK